MQSVVDNSGPQRIASGGKFNLNLHLMGNFGQQAISIAVQLVRALLLLRGYFRLVHE